MDDDRTPAEYVATDLSTRPVRIDGTDHITVVTREALEGIAQQVTERFIPVVVEHLKYLPPIGRWHAAVVVEAADGEFELKMHGSALPQLVPPRDDPPDPLLIVSELPDACPPAVSARLEFDARSFEPDDLAALHENPPLPLREVHQWSSLPPLIWSLSIPVVWGACRFSGAFFETLGRESAEGVAGWLRAAWNRSKEPNRDRMLSLEFELDDGSRIYGFIVSPADAKGVVDGHLAAGLEAAATLASFAGVQGEEDVLPGMREAAFIFADQKWRLAWWTDGMHVLRTRWFEDNVPDPERFLGRPLTPRKMPSGVEEPRKP